MATETLPYTVLYATPRPSGRSTTTIRCPFCQHSIVAYNWSLAGSGKRCSCRALFARGTATVS